MPRYTIAYGPQTIKAIQSGDVNALLRAIACLAEQWSKDAMDASAFFAFPLGAARAAIDADPAKRVLAAVAQELAQTMLLSPQGREACADFCARPLPQKVEGE